MLKSLALLGFVMEVMFLLLLQSGDLRRHVDRTIALQVQTSVFYLISTYLVLKIPSSPRGGRLSGLILGAGLIFRLTVWPLFPAFSGDVFRYRWEGELQSLGGNPYQVRPNDVNWAGMRDAAFTQVTVPDFKTGYGPLTELLELATYQAASSAVSGPFAQAFWFKLPAAFFDLCTVGALSWLLWLKRLPLERVLIYAWCPLPIFEFWVNGHNDSTLVFFVLAALAFAAAKRPTWALWMVSLAAAAKIWPAILLPLFIRPWRVGMLVRAVCIFGVVMGVCAWPYWSDVTENVRFTSGFLGGWRNNDFLFGFLLALVKDNYRAKYLAFAALAVWALAVVALRPALEKGALLIITAMLAISANIHPWYLTWFVPLLAIVPVVPLFLWIALMPLTYAVLIDWLAVGVWNGSTSIRWYVYAPVIAYWLASGIRVLAQKRSPRP